MLLQTGSEITICVDFFWPFFTPYGIFSQPGHTFANYKLLKDKGKVTDAFTKLGMALKKLLRLITRNLGTISSLSSQELSVINALDNNQFQPPLSSQNDYMMLHVANLFVQLHLMVHPSRSPSYPVGNDIDNDSNSINPADTNESISAVH